MKLFLRQFLVLLVSLPLVSEALAETPISTLLTPKQVAISATVPKKNNSTGNWDVYVTIKNKTKPKLRQNFYGPLTLIVNAANNPEVVLINKTGQISGGQPYLDVPVSDGGLAAGKTIKRIALQFSNPGNKAFKAKYQVMGYLSPYTPPQIPGVATLIAPTGTINTAKPTYSWNRVPTATSYMLRVIDSSGEKILESYSSDSAGCAIETASVCRVTPVAGLAEGSGQWWIKTSNNKGSSEWSSPLSFMLSTNQDTDNTCNDAPSIRASLTDIVPAEAASGATISLVGENFTHCSKVMLGDVELLAKHLISENRMEVIVPFAMDSTGKISPMPASTYPLSIDGVAKDFSVTTLNLPENPNTPGVVITEEANKFIDTIRQNQAAMDVIFNSLINDNTNTQQQSDYWRKLQALIYQANERAQRLFSEAVAGLDQETLSLVESILIAKKADIEQLNSEKSIAKAMSSTAETQDQWLLDRKGFLDSNGKESLNTVTTISSWCAVIAAIPWVATTNPGLLALKASCLLIALEASTMKKIIETDAIYKFGLVKKMSLDIPPIGVKDKHSLYFNNFDNNENEPSTKALRVNGVVAVLTKTPDKASSLLDLAGQIQSLVTVMEASGLTEKIKDFMLDKILAFLGEKFDDWNQPIVDEKYFSINTLEWGQQASTSSDCSFPASADEWFIRDKGKGIFSAPDPGGYVEGGVNVGTCAYQILEAYRLSGEDRIKTIADFHVEKYSKVVIEVGSGGKVSYSDPLPLSGRIVCEEMQKCVEYWNPALVNEKRSIFIAEPYQGGNKSIIKWVGTNCQAGDDKCNVSWDVTNRNYPALSVFFTKQVNKVLLTIKSAEEVNGKKSDWSSNLTGTIELTNFTSHAPNNKLWKPASFSAYGTGNPGCEDGERGGPVFTESVIMPIDYFLAAKSTTNIPYQNDTPINRGPCSSFVAVKTTTNATGSTSSDMQLWVNATGRAVQSFFGEDWEYQVRYYSGNPDYNKTDSSCTIGVVPNSGNYVLDFMATCEVELVYDQ